MDIISRVYGIYRAFKIILNIILIGVFAINTYIGIKGYKCYEKLMAFYWFVIGFFITYCIVGLILIGAIQETDSNILSILGLILIFGISIVAGWFARKLNKFVGLNNVCFGFLTGFYVVIQLFFTKYFPSSLDSIFEYVYYSVGKSAIWSVLPILAGIAMVVYAFMKNKQFRIISTSLAGGGMCTLCFCSIFGLFKFYTIFYILIFALFLFLQIKGINNSGEENPFKLKLLTGSNKQGVLDNPVYCGKCGAKVNPDTSFCSECGNKIK